MGNRSMFSKLWITNNNNIEDANEKKIEEEETKHISNNYVDDDSLDGVEHYLSNFECDDLMKSPLKYEDISNNNKSSIFEEEKETSFLSDGKQGIEVEGRQYIGNSLYEAIFVYQEPLLPLPESNIVDNTLKKGTRMNAFEKKILKEFGVVFRKRKEKQETVRNPLMINSDFFAIEHLNNKKPCLIYAKKRNEAFFSVYDVYSKNETITLYDIQRFMIYLKIPLEYQNDTATLCYQYFF